MRPSGRPLARQADACAQAAWMIQRPTSGAIDELAIEQRDRRLPQRQQPG
jgi:hypothetical protein